MEKQELSDNESKKSNDGVDSVVAQNNNAFTGNTAINAVNSAEQMAPNDNDDDYQVFNSNQSKNS